MTTSDPVPTDGHRADVIRTRARPVAPAVEPIDAPTQDDSFVRGLSEAIGGPAGKHRTGRRSGTGWSYGSSSRSHASR